MKTLIIEDLAFHDLLNIRDFFNTLSSGWGDHLIIRVDQELNKLPSLEILNHPVVHGFQRLVSTKSKQNIY